jgi:hypothetical protein
MNVTGKIALEQAFTWRCPKCGKRFFERALNANLSDDDLRKMLGLSPVDSIPEEYSNENGGWVMAPETVTCSCGALYEVEDCPEDV